jgi:hypothetical protein|nr:hypothetical protein [Nitrosomonas nitrosa]
MEQQQFALLASADAITDVCVCQSSFDTPDPYSVLVWANNDKEPQTILTARGERREWSNLERLNDWIRRHGYTGQIRLLLKRAQAI